MRQQYRYTFNLSRANERYDDLITVLYRVGGCAALAQVTEYLGNQRRQARMIGNLERHGLAVRKTIAPPKNRGMYLALTSMGINRIADHLDAKRITYAAKPTQQRLVTSFARFGYYARHWALAQPLSDAIPVLAAQAAHVQQKHISEYGHRLAERYTALAKLPTGPKVVAERARIQAEHQALKAQWPTEEALTMVLRSHLNIRGLYIDLKHSDLAEVCYVYVDQGDSPSRYQRLMSKLSRSVVTLSMTARLRVLADCPHRLSQLGTIFTQAARLNKRAAEMDRYLPDRIVLEPIDLGIARYFAHTAEMSDLFGEEEEAAIVQAVLERRS